MDVEVELAGFELRDLRRRDRERLLRNDSRGRRQRDGGESKMTPALLPAAAAP
jgi:hypothetical protein